MTDEACGKILCISLLFGLHSVAMESLYISKYLQDQIFHHLFSAQSMSRKITWAEGVLEKEEASEVKIN